ncbi:hypothetical protein J6590_008810 [Homalodisca vitripennis]|nr:hypothetical protein J6590_008810 [Homalodisca vitripennis]
MFYRSIDGQRPSLVRRPPYNGTSLLGTKAQDFFHDGHSIDFKKPSVYFWGQFWEGGKDIPVSSRSLRETPASEMSSEPSSLHYTANCSTIFLLRKIYSKMALFSQRFAAIFPAVEPLRKLRSRIRISFSKSGDFVGTESTDEPN